MSNISIECGIPNFLPVTQPFRRNVSLSGFVYEAEKGLKNILAKGLTIFPSYIFDPEEELSRISLVQVLIPFCG